MTPEVGKQYELTDTFAYSGLNWGQGTIITVIEYPYMEEHFGELRCAATGGEPSQLEVVICTPIELLKPLGKKRRRRKTVTSQPTKRRRRRANK